MSTAERWAWHTEVYAFRRVCLGRGENTSPCDPDGIWFDAGLVDAAERAKRAKRESIRRPPVSDSELQAEESYAKAAGWPSALARKDAIVRNEERYSAGLRWQANHAAELKVARVGGFKSAAAALGVTAREFNPSPEEMAASRRHLGIDPPLDPPDAAPRVQAKQREMGGDE